MWICVLCLFAHCVYCGVYFQILTVTKLVLQQILIGVTHMIESLFFLYPGADSQQPILRTVQLQRPEMNYRQIRFFIENFCLLNFYYFTDRITSFNQFVTSISLWLCSWQLILPIIQLIVCFQTREMFYNSSFKVRIVCQQQVKKSLSVIGCCAFGHSYTLV